MKPAFDVLHGLLTDRDAFLIDGVAELHNRMEPLPGHTTGPSEHGLSVKQLGAIPMQFQNPPATLDGIVLAVIGREVEEVNRLLDLINPFDYALEKLGPRSAAFRSVIHFDGK